MKYKITNPYQSVTKLIPKEENHYKTNLHTHSTYSDAEVDFNDMIKEYYKHGFDVLAMTDHGVIGKKWTDAPTEIPLYQHQYILGRTKTPLTFEENKEITEGTRPAPEWSGRKYGRGMNCLTSGIELNMVTLTKCHVNGFFCDFGQNNWGFENGYVYAVKKVDEAGGISFINHPGGWLESTRNVENAYKYENVRYFGEIFNKYKSCIGTEVFNSRGGDTKNDRIFWDELLKYVVPHGERNIFGFANSDAHFYKDVNTSFEDFILPEYSEENMKYAMTHGCFFAVSRYAKNELGEDFVASTTAYPQVFALEVDEENGIISVKGKNTDRIEWIADGKIIKTSDKKTKSGYVNSEIKLEEYENDISCYIRFQLIGEGGVTLSQPFILDDGNIERFIKSDTRSDKKKFVDNALFNLKSTRVAVIADEIHKARKKKKAKKKNMG